MANGVRFGVLGRLEVVVGRECVDAARFEGLVEQARQEKPEHLLAEFDEHGRHLADMLRRGTVAGPSWVLTSPVADLAVHLSDLHEALGQKPDPNAAVTRLGFAAYRTWLQARIGQAGLPQLRLSDGTMHGEGPTVTAERHDLFRAITGRASAAEIRAYEWSVDPDIYLPVISPCPLPAQNGA